LQATRKISALLIICIIVVGAVVEVYVSKLREVPSISLAPSTLVVVQGTQIAFTIFGLEPNGVATIYFGDGHQTNTTSTVTYAYQLAGRYLVGAEEFINGQSAASTFGALQTIQVNPQVSLKLAPLISVPVISFDTSRNPIAPVAQVDESVYFYAGYQEQPSGVNVSITKYDWDFDNTVTRSIPANLTSFNPAENPITTTYDQPGLHAVKLTLVTENSTSLTTYETSVMQTVAIGSTSQPYAVFLYQGSVPNPSVINVAELQPGGPYSFDPNVDEEVVGQEIINNIFSSLCIFNGSSTTNFIPMIAAQMPSVANGEISKDLSTYRFQIRGGLRFSNGDPLTAYDVWYSFIRSALFSSNPSNPILWGPSVANATDTADYNTIMSSFTYSNSSNTVTINNGSPINPDEMFDDAPYVLDAKWLEQVGAGITFTPAGFYAYEQQAYAGHYNQQVRWAPVASGPYMIQSYTPGQSITLMPNPGWAGVSGIPVMNNTVVIRWVKDRDTAWQLFESGQADVGAYIQSKAPEIRELVANGQAALYQFPSLSESVFAFNFAINETLMGTEFGSQYHIPSGYFTNLDVRKAFAYAFNYTNYIEVLQGNVKYGIDFGDGFTSVIPPGVPDYVPETELQNVPIYNLTYAKELLQESGEFNLSVNLPIVIMPADRLDFAAAQMWASAISSIDPNIVMIPVYASSWPTYYGWLTEGGNPMPLYATDFTPAPFPDSCVGWLYLSGGFFPGADGWDQNYLNSTGHPDEAAVNAQMNSLANEADNAFETANQSLAAQDYRELEQLGINMYMYVYLTISNGFWLVKPYMAGYRGQISYQMNPVWGGLGEGQYYWWVKGCENPEACSGRSIGP